MKITLRLLKQLKACEDGIEFYKKVDQPDNYQDCIKLAMKQYEFGFANWFISRLLKKESVVKYAVYAAEQVLYIYEKEYPKDNQPRLAIEKAKEYINKPSSDTAAAAYAAAHAAHAAAHVAHAAAYAAAHAAHAAAHAAYAAAHAAAYAADAAYAAYAADAAAHVAYAAAHAVDATVYAAHAVDDLKIKIINYGLELLKEVNK